MSVYRSNPYTAIADTVDFGPSIVDVEEIKETFRYEYDRQMEGEPEEHKEIAITNGLCAVWIAGRLQGRMDREVPLKKSLDPRRRFPDVTMTDNEAQRIMLLEKACGRLHSRAAMTVALELLRATPERFNIIVECLRNSIQTPKVDTEA